MQVSAVQNAANWWERRIWDRREFMLNSKTGKCMAQGFLKLGVIWPYGKAMHPAQRADEEAVPFFYQHAHFSSQVPCFILGMIFSETRSYSRRFISEAISHVSC